MSLYLWDIDIQSVFGNCRVDPNHVRKCVADLRRDEVTQNRSQDGATADQDNQQNKIGLIASQQMVPFGCAAVSRNYGQQI
ncbi:MAG: hypothetical protein ACRD4Q_12020 [Candidatus Acidiferrales bacterium]